MLKDIAADIVGVGMKRAEYILTNRSDKQHQPKSQKPAKTPAQTQDQPNYMKTSLDTLLCLLDPCPLKRAVKNEQRMIAHLEVEHGRGGAEARSPSDDALIPALRESHIVV
uniref:Uncharacterized protein n=1 Tax=Ditylenchus dipsaci TaxID=166011 RepID=A0A915D2P3_9BILA